MKEGECVTTENNVLLDPKVADNIRKTFEKHDHERKSEKKLKVLIKEMLAREKEMKIHDHGDGGYDDYLIGCLEHALKESEKV